MPRRLLLGMTLAMMLLASGLAAADDPPATESVAAPFGVTLTCSARLPAIVLGCFVERPVLVLGAFELALGMDAQASFSGAAQGHLAPYAVAAYYADSWSAWLEVRLPALDGIPILGDPDYLRIGFTARL